jgi:hypothetical protein
MGTPCPCAPKASPQSTEQMASEMLLERIYMLPLLLSCFRFKPAWRGADLPSFGDHNALAKALSGQGKIARCRLRNSTLPCTP